MDALPLMESPQVFALSSGKAICGKIRCRELTFCREFSLGSFERWKTAMGQYVTTNQVTENGLWRFSISKIEQLPIAINQKKQNDRNP